MTQKIEFDFEASHSPKPLNILSCEGSVGMETWKNKSNAPGNVLLKKIIKRKLPVVTRSRGITYKKIKYLTVVSIGRKPYLISALVRISYEPRGKPFDAEEVKFVVGLYEIVISQKEITIGKLEIICREEIDNEAKDLMASF